LRPSGETGKGRRLFLHDFGGYPFTIQLAREFAARGYRTTYVYFRNLPGPKGNFDNAGASGELKIHGVRTTRDFQKYNYFKRALQECEYGLRVASRVVRVGPGVVVSANTPPIAQFFITLATRLVRASGIVWVQDVFGVASGSILSAKMGALGRVSGIVLKRVDRLNLALSDSVVTISRSFSDALRAAGVDEDKITTMANWAPLDQIHYHRDKPGAWGGRHELGGKFCVMYTGALGDKHDPSPLLHLATHCEKDDAARVVVVSEGPGAEFLKKEAVARNLKALVVLPYQPFDTVSDMMAEADVLVATLTGDASGFSVPSKVLSYLCAGRAIVCLMDRGNDAARLVEGVGAGIVIDPGDVQAFIEACASLMVDESRRRAMGNRGRKYAEETFDIDRIADEFEQRVLKPRQA